MATSLGVRLLLIGAMVWASTATAATGINNDACLRGTGSHGLDACRSLTDAIGEDLPRLNAHGRVLEELGRHESAMLMYQAAATFFPTRQTRAAGVGPFSCERASKPHYPRSYAATDGHVAVLDGPLGASLCCVPRRNGEPSSRRATPRTTRRRRAEYWRRLGGAPRVRTQPGN